MTTMAFSGGFTCQGSVHAKSPVSFTMGRFAVTRLGTTAGFSLFGAKIIECSISSAMEADLRKRLAPSGTGPVVPTSAGASLRTAVRRSQLGAASSFASVAIRRAESRAAASAASSAIDPRQVSAQRSISPSIHTVSISSDTSRREPRRSSTAWARTPGRRQVISEMAGCRPLIRTDSSPRSVGSC